MPCPIDFSSLSSMMIDLNKLTSLPWKPMYAQSSEETEATVTSTYAMALTILFTVFVFSFEHMLDERQALAYKSKEFPALLEQTVGKIDAEKKANPAQKEEKKDEASDDDKKKLDKDKPILPQLKEKFTKAQLYGTDKINFGMISSLYNLIESVGFLIIGFLPYTWDYSVKLGEAHFGYNEQDNEIKISLIFLLLTTILGTVTALPFELYSTFKIEKKHGFNKQTLGLFFSDKVKSLILTCIIGGPFVAALLKIIKWGGENFYLYVWAFMFVFSAFMMTIVPVFIMPLFNKVRTCFASYDL